CDTHKIWRANQESTDLLRKQLVGSQGAIIEASQPVWNSTTQTLSITLVNSNQNGVAGKAIGFNARLQRKKWPGETPIGEQFSIVLLNEIVLQKQGQFPIEKGLPWPLPPQTNDMRHWPGGEIVTLEGDYTYTNGFDDTHFTKKFCYLWLAPFTFPAPGNWSQGQWSGGYQGCPSVAEKITEFKGWEKHYREVTVNQPKQP